MLHGTKDEYDCLVDIIEDPVLQLNQERQDKMQLNGKHNGSERKSLSLNQGAEALSNAIRQINN